MLYGDKAENRNRRRMIYDALTIICEDDNMAKHPDLSWTHLSVFWVNNLYIPLLILLTISKISRGIIYVWQEKIL